MLILSRRIEEVIRIGDNIKITVCRIERGQVKLGIDAPREIPVHREEIYRAIRCEGKRHKERGRGSAQSTNGAVVQRSQAAA